MSIKLIAKTKTPPNGGYLFHQHSTKHSLMWMLKDDFGA